MKGQPRVVAVVDDEADVLRALRRLLRSEGFDVLVYESGLDFMKDFGTSDLDCLVVDLHMPQMTGFDVLEALRDLPDDPERPPVIVLTGNDTPTGRARALGGGAHSYLCKPTDADVLIQAINAAIDQRANPAQPT